MDQSKKTNGAAVVYTYRGQDAHGNLRLHGFDEELLIAGALYAASSPSKKPPGDPRKIALVELKRSPNFVRNREEDSTYTARTETGERVRVIGKVLYTRTIPKLEVKKIRVISLRQEASKVKAPLTTSLEKTSLQKNKPGAKPTKDEQFAKKLKHALMLESCGEDDDVQMSFVHKFVNRSPANVYLKLSKGKFPQPYKKVAGCTFWKFSVIRAYKEGRWQSESEQP